MTAAAGTYRIGVISDTHGFLHPKVFEIFEGVDMICHGGDVENDEILIELETIAPVRAVSGNVDFPPDPQRRPLEQRLETPAGRIGMVHGHLPAASAFDPSTLVAHFHDFDPDTIIHGHTHVPFLGNCEGVRLFNPGSAGRPSGGRPPTVGLITADGSAPVKFEHVRLD